MSRKRTSSSSETGAEALVCPRCARRHPLDERFCASCGMPLVYAREGAAEEPESPQHERARKIRPELTRGEPVRVAGGRNQAEAELIQNLLLEEGIPSMLRRTAGFDVPDFLAAGPRDVLVPESGAAQARAVLATTELEQSPVPTGEGPSRRHVASVVAATLGGGLLAALIAWLLLQSAG